MQFTIRNLLTTTLIVAAFVLYWNWRQQHSIDSITITRIIRPQAASLVRGGNKWTIELEDSVQSETSIMLDLETAFSNNSGRAASVCTSVELVIERENDGFRIKHKAAHDYRSSDWAGLRFVARSPKKNSITYDAQMHFPDKKPVANKSLTIEFSVAKNNIR